MPAAIRLPSGAGRPHLALGAALALLGCPRVPPPDLSANPAELLRAVQAHQARADRVQGRARLQVDAPGLKGSLDALAAARRPDRLRLEILDFFGNPAAVLVASGGRFLFFDGRQGTWTRGDATPANVSQLLPVALPAEELVEVLCGAAPLVGDRAVEASPGRGVMRLSVERGDLLQRLEVGPEAAVETSQVRRRTGHGEEPAGYDLRFSLFRHHAGVRFPTELVLDARPARTRLSVSWGSDLEVNGRLDDGLFQLAPPPGATVVELPPGAAAPAVELPFRSAE